MNVGVLIIHETWTHKNGVLISGNQLTLTTALVQDKRNYLEVLVHEHLARMFSSHCAWKNKVELLTLIYGY